MIWIRQGITREVILTKKWAFKFPSIRGWRFFLLGLLANMHECSWSSFECGGLLCPVKFSLPKGFLVVMPRVKVKEDDITDEEIQPFIDASLRFVSDIKPDNFGYLNGNLVCIDYGGFL